MDEGDVAGRGAKSAWVPAPDSLRARAWACRFVDEDGQLCAGRVNHAGDHAGAGLRAWLEANPGDAFERTYEGDFAEDLCLMEQPLMAAFGFVPTVDSDTVENRKQPATPGELLLWRGLPPESWVVDRRIRVRYRRVDPSTIGQDAP